MLKCEVSIYIIRVERDDMTCLVDTSPSAGAGAAETARLKKRAARRREKMFFAMLKLEKERDLESAEEIRSVGLAFIR